MPYPAAIPALAIVVGATAACWIDVDPRWPAAFAVASWITAIAACARRSPRSCVVLVALACAGAEWALAAAPFREAEHPAPHADLAGQLPTPSPLLLAGRVRNDATPSSAGVLLDVSAEDASTLDGTTLAVSPGGVRLSVAGGLAAAQAGDWTAGRRVRAPASLRLPTRFLDPGVRDARLEQARRGITLVGGVKSGALVDVLAAGSWWQERAAALRQFARQAIGRHVGRWSPRSAGIVTAILIGDRAGLDEDVRLRLQEAGTYHVIAISGGNIAVLAGLVLTVLRAARVTNRTGCWVTMAVLAGYAVLVGGGPPVVRATLMAVAILAARQADHRSPPLNALGVACGVILALTPLSLVDVGFALTFGATLGILVAARAISVWPSGPRVLRPALSLLLASLAAELALFPVSAYAFSRVTFAGLLLNFVAIPLMSLAQVAGLLVLALAVVASRAAAAAGWMAHLGAHGLVESAGLLDVAPWLSWRLPPPRLGVIGCYYAAWCLYLCARLGARGVGGRTGRRVRRASALAITASAAWILTEPVTRVFPGVSGRLRVTVLDVGHADAILVQLPDRRSLLVDTGGATTAGAFDIGGRVVVPAAWALGTRRLDALVVSHGDPDHVGGSSAVVRDLRPKEIWEGVPVPSLPALQRLHDEAGRAGIRVSARRAGEQLALGEVLLRIHNPPVPDWERRRVRNDDSVVLELRYRGVSIVLPGDIGSEVERAIAPRFEPARFRVLKVPHHGSATSSTAGFLEAVRPNVAVISAAASTRVPQVVADRYVAAGAALFRTSSDGAVTITTDGVRVVVETRAGRTVTFPVGRPTPAP